MILPAAAARFWARDLAPMSALAVALGLLSSVAGLLLSYHLSVASGPAIVLSAGVLYGASLLLAPRGVLRGRAVHRRYA
jgi:zinc/manganese transport system permease protein